MAADERPKVCFLIIFESRLAKNVNEKIILATFFAKYTCGNGQLKRQAYQNEAKNFVYDLDGVNANSLKTKQHSYKRNMFLAATLVV